MTTNNREFAVPVEWFARKSKEAAPKPAGMEGKMEKSLVLQSQSPVKLKNFQSEKLVGIFKIKM